MVRTPADNSTLAIGGVFPMKNRDRLYSAYSFVVDESSGLRMNPPAGGMVKITTFAKPENVMPHSKKTTVQQTNDRNMTERKANPSAKPKELKFSNRTQTVNNFSTIN